MPDQPILETDQPVIAGLAEPRFTEAEWRKRDAQHVCAEHGHDWHVTISGGQPVALRCDRPCGLPPYRIVSQLLAAQPATVEELAQS